MAAGKNKMQGVGAVMHKLIRVVYGGLNPTNRLTPKSSYRPLDGPEPTQYLRCAALPRREWGRLGAAGGDGLQLL